MRTTGRAGWWKIEATDFEPGLVTALRADDRGTPCTSIALLEDLARSRRSTDSSRSARGVDGRILANEGGRRLLYATAAGPCLFEAAPYKTDRPVPRRLCKLLHSSPWNEPLGPSRADPS